MVTRTRSKGAQGWRTVERQEVRSGAGAAVVRTALDGSGAAELGINVPSEYIYGSRDERGAISERMLSGNFSAGNFQGQRVVQFGIRLDDSVKITAPFEQSPWVRTGLKAIAGGFVQLRPKILDRPPMEEDAKEIEVPELKRFLAKPNPIMTQRRAMRALATDYKLTGDVFWFLRGERGPIEHDSQGLFTEYPSQMIPAAGRMVEHKLDEATGFPVAYRYVTSAKKGKKTNYSDEFTPAQVIHFADYDPANLVRGLGDVQSAKREIDLYLLASRFLDASVAAGGNPGGVVTYKHRLAPYELEARQETLEDELNGEGSQRWKILDGDAKFTPFSVTPKDMEYRGLLEWLRDVILSMIGVPGPVVGVYESATFNNVATAHIEMWRGPNGILTLGEETGDSLTEDLVHRCAGINPSLKDAVFHFDASHIDVLREERTEQVRAAAEIAALRIGASANSALTAMGVDTQLEGGDEVLEPEDLNPEPAPADPDVGANAKDEKAHQGAQQRDEESLPVEAPPEREKGGDPTLRANVLGWLTAYTRAAKAHIREVVKNENSSSGLVLRGLDSTYHPEDLSEADWRELLLDDTEWIAAMTEATGAPLESIYAQALESAQAGLPGSPILSTSDPRVFRALTVQQIQLSEGATSTAARAVRRTILEALASPAGMQDGLTMRQRIQAVLPELTPDLERIFGDPEVRAATVAQTETGKATMGGKYEQWRASGVTEIQWFTSQDPNVRLSHKAIHGEKVALGGTFTNGLRYPLDERGNAEDVINCRCDAVPSKRIRVPDPDDES